MSLRGCAMDVVVRVWVSAGVIHCLVLSTSAEKGFLRKAALETNLVWGLSQISAVVR